LETSREIGFGLLATEVTEAQAEVTEEILLSPVFCPLFSRALWPLCELSALCGEEFDSWIPGFPSRPPSSVLQPLAGIELDDRSHNEDDRQQRDAFVDELYRSCSLPLLHVPAQAAYNQAELRAKIGVLLAAIAPSASA
jgi:hypothetical protein